jgi:energy-coupling factor transporter ATP-binding protein EcfA2
MITQVSIKNFKCLRDVTVNLEPFTIFVGANGSGKTSFLQALDLLCRTFITQPGQLNGEYAENRSFGATDQVELSCLAGEIHYRYRPPSPDQQQQLLMGQFPKSCGIELAKNGPALDWKPCRPQHGLLPNPVWLRLDPNALRNAGPFNNGDPRIMLPNGKGLHAATAAMNLEEPDLWLNLQSDLRRIVPAICRLRHTPQNELLFDTVNGKGLMARQVSEGTLLTLGLLTAIYGVNKPGILLLDDLDRAMHPKAQRELIELLRGVQTTKPEIQIVATTHSPYMLDSMKPKEVLVTWLREDGSTACEPITHHPKFEKWKDEFHPGEMWSVFGEKWVAGAEVATK